MTTPRGGGQRTPPRTRQRAGRGPSLRPPRPSRPAYLGPRPLPRRCAPDPHPDPADPGPSHPPAARSLPPARTLRLCCGRARSPRAAGRKTRAGSAPALRSVREQAAEHFRSVLRGAASGPPIWPPGRSQEPPTISASGTGAQSVGGAVLSAEGS